MANSDARNEKWVALLGRRDSPTDGVEDYCAFLGQALRDRGVHLEQVRVLWFERGWVRALLKVRKERKAWRGNWVLLQHTPMAWSRRGFPFGILIVEKMLRSCGVRTAVIFHEPFSPGGPRWVDRIRRASQDWVVRQLYKHATKAIFADPLAKVAWLPLSHSKAIFIPIGANVPAYQPESDTSQNGNGRAKTVVVFCLSDIPNRTRELGDIRDAMNFVSDKGIEARLVFLGRGSDDAGAEIDQVFGSSQFEVVNLGLQSAEKVSKQLGQSDAMLCVRGPLYLRRGSAIAGIACGLPIVAYAGAAEGTLLEEAGICLVPYRNSNALGRDLANILADDATRVRLRKRSLEAYRRNFSWNVIASTFETFLGRHDGAVT